MLAHEEPWHCALDVLKEAKLILLLEQEGQIELLQKLLLIPGLPQVVCFSKQMPALELFDPRQATFFPWVERASKIENITEDRMIRLAKTVNLRYAHHYAGTEETEAALETEWKKLNAFTRYSNISAADYHEMRLKMLDDLSLPRRLSDIPPAVQEQLAELEHERWCRYHYLNNWTYGTPADGAGKDPALRIHSDLIPYAALTDAEKKKDFENIEVLMSI